MTQRPSQSAHSSIPIWSSALLLASLGAWEAVSHAATPNGGDVKNNCFWELARGQGADLICQYPAWLADKERDEMRRLTRDTLKDARCTVSIKIARSLLKRALTETNMTFEAPPQSVACEVTTGETAIPVEATFSPRVVIKGGVAITATPGLANVTGVNDYLAWPVVEYVNRSATVRTEMLKMINAYLNLRSITPDVNSSGNKS